MSSACVQQRATGHNATAGAECQACGDVRRFRARYLHSTGQAYKGGPNTGVFLLITHEQASDAASAGAQVHVRCGQAAQAGRFQVLAERDRRILRVHLGPDVPAGLEA